MILDAQALSLMHSFVDGFGATALPRCCQFRRGGAAMMSADCRADEMPALAMNGAVGA